MLDDPEATIRRAQLRAAIDAISGGNASEFARRARKPPQQINDMLADPPRKSFGSKVARAIEAEVGLPPRFLDTPGAVIPADEIRGGNVVADSRPETPAIIPAHENIGNPPPPSRLIPLISWVRAGSFCEVHDPYPIGVADDWLPCPMDCSAGTFAVEVIGDSMEPEYREGECIYVDPALRVRHGDDVIVRTPDGRTTFKRYQDTPEGKFLLVLNESFKNRRIEVPEGTEFCGVVIGSWRRRRK